MARIILKRAAGLAVVALLIGGWGIAAHAQVCESANCMIRVQEANDPAYQAAIHGGWYAPYPYYSYSYMYPYGGYAYPYGYYPYPAPYQPYQTYSYSTNSNYSYQYQYQYGY